MGIVHSTEEEQNAYISRVIGQLSPRFGEFASDVLVHEVEPVIQRTLHSHKSDGAPSDDSILNPDSDDADDHSAAHAAKRAVFHFEKTDLGTITPKITDLKTHEARDGEDRIVADFTLEYQGDCDMHVKLLGIGSGVKNVGVSGRCRLILTPTLRSLPFIGGVQLLFLDQPKIDFEFEGLAGIGDWPGLRGKIRRELQEDVAERCVFPNRVSVTTSGRTDPELTKSFYPSGFLLVKLHGVSGLPKKKGLSSLIGQSKPDCYAKLSLGAANDKTPVVKNSCAPEWPDSLLFEYPLETLEGHTLDIRLFDHDVIGKDEFLGRTAFKVAQLPMGTDITMTLEDDESETSKYHDEIAGELTLDMRWLQLVPAQGGEVPQAVVENQSTVAIVSVFVYSCNNLMELGVDGSLQDDLPTTRVVLSLGEDQVFKSDWQKNDPHPSFEYGCIFKLKVGTVESSEILVELFNKDETRIGKLHLAALELMEKPMKRRMIQVDPDNRPHITATLSANVKLLQLPAEE